MPLWIIRVPAPPAAGAAPDTRVDYGVIEAPNPALARQQGAPIVRWEAGRIEAVPCEAPSEWITVQDRVRYDALFRMSRSLLSEKDRRFLVAMAAKRPLKAST